MLAVKRVVPRRNPTRSRFARDPTSCDASLDLFTRKSLLCVLCALLTLGFEHVGAAGASSGGPQRSIDADLLKFRSPLASGLDLLESGFHDCRVPGSA